MTNREKEILDIIKQNPMISQKEIADTLKITRSSVAVHITNLIKKGFIRGKGYIVDENDYVLVIGSACIDIHGFTQEKLLYEDSNPGFIKVSCGGVGRNISENLSRFGVSVKLITALGDDIYGKKIVEESRQCGINIDDSLIMEGKTSSMYMSILDNDGDMKLALCDADIVEKITIDFIKSKFHIISKAKIIILDTGLTKDVIEYIVTTFRDVPIFLDPVSIKRGRKVKDIIGYFDTIKLNTHEAECLSNMNIHDENDLFNASLHFINKGVKNVFITLGKDGVYYRNKEKCGLLPGFNVNVINATGAGDAFMAGVVYCNLNNYDIDYCALFSTGAAILTLSHENTINPGISVNSILNKLEELNYAK